MARVARVCRGWRGLWTTQEFVVGSSLCRGWRGSGGLAGAHVRARARARGPADPRVCAYTRAPVPHHPHHSRQEDEEKGEFRGEGLPRVARAKPLGEEKCR